MKYNLTCLECKNNIDLSPFEDALNDYNPDNEEDIIIECNHCGTAFMVKNLNDDNSLEVEFYEEDK